MTWTFDFPTLCTRTNKSSMVSSPIARQPMETVLP
jgi:hypothetical protein